MVCSKCGEKFHNALSCSQNPKNIKSPTDALLYLQGQLIDMPLPEGDLLKISNGLKKIYDDKSVGEWTVESEDISEHDIHLVVDDYEYVIKKCVGTWLKKGSQRRKDWVTTGTVQHGLTYPKEYSSKKCVERTVMSILEFHHSEKITVMMGPSRKEFIYSDFIAKCIETDKLLKKAKAECPPNEDDDCAMEAYMWVGDYRYRRMIAHISNIIA
jgi:hypothetical protein